MVGLKNLAQCFESLFGLFASERRSGLKNIICLISLCLLIGLGASCILYISLQALHCGLVVSLTVCGIFAAIIPGALFLSKHLRCFILIVLISCGTQQGRNALITAGTGVVLFKCAQNSFHNLKGLVESLECNLENMLPSIENLLAKYINILQWIHQQIQNLPQNVFVKFPVHFEIKHSIRDGELKQNLNETKVNLEGLANHMISTLDMFSQVCKGAVIILGLLLALIFTGLYIKRYLSNIKFENIYITNHFLQFNEQQKEKGKPHLLQLTQKERKSFIKIPAFSFSERERKALASFCVPILIKVCIWTTVIMLDYGLFLLISSIKHHLDHLPPINITMDFQFVEEIIFIKTPLKRHKSRGTFSYVTHLSKADCIPQPTLTISNIWTPLIVIIAALLLLTLFSAKFTILKVLVLSSFYSETEKRRIEFLHEKILRKRAWVKLMGTEETQNFTDDCVSFWFPIFRMKQRKGDLLQKTEFQHQSSHKLCVEL
ncbi:dendritic cell-specific transmembrane protein [Rhincodon typus]|uniref:dendritic cell-specific transmembrane protein n=1 Tax=Rhincodon typus TaxID=259920 RepID=UPI0020300817|nr:dendritic cell-specific transmembrane protein [Rhincodon typus]